MPLPPEVDDAISPRSTLRPPRKSFAYALRTSASRPVGYRNKRVSQSEASTPSRHRTRCAPTVSAPTPMLHTADALQHTLSTAIAVVRYLPCTKCFWQSLLAPFSTASWRYTIIAFFPTLRCTRIIRLAAERICRQWNTSANILRFALHGGQRHGSPSICRSGSEQEIVATP